MIHENYVVVEEAIVEPADPDHFVAVGAVALGSQARMGMAPVGQPPNLGHARGSSRTSLTERSDPPDCRGLGQLRLFQKLMADASFR